MTKYHISGDGKPNPCKAKKACPLGDDTPHGEFDSPEAAVAWAGKVLESQYGGVVGQSLKKQARPYAEFENHFSLNTIKEAEIKADEIINAGGISFIHELETTYPELDDRQAESRASGDLTDGEAWDSSPRVNKHYWIKGFENEEALEEHLKTAIEFSEEDFSYEFEAGFTEEISGTPSGSENQDKIERSTIFVKRP